MVHITAANSINSTSPDARSASGPDTLIVDADAFIIDETAGVAARLDGAWTIHINGEVGTFANNFAIDLAPDSPADTSKIIIGKRGDVFGSNPALNLSQPVTITNFGTIYSGIGTPTIKGNFETHIINAGFLLGNMLTAEENNSFTNFTNVGHHIKNGTVVGVIDSTAGRSFHRRREVETVIDGAGDDTYKLGGGGDKFIAMNTGSGTGADIGAFPDTGLSRYDALSKAAGRRMRRREFITFLSSAVAWSFTARAQRPERIRRIGSLTGTADDPIMQPRRAAFVQALQQLGWTDGGQRANRLSLGWGRCRPHSQKCGGIGRTRAGRHSGHWRCGHGAVA